MRVRVCMCVCVRACVRVCSVLGGSLETSNIWLAENVLDLLQDNRSAVFVCLFACLSVCLFIFTDSNIANR